MSHIDLRPFCDDSPSRYDIMTPWRMGDFVYATDGRICIRVDASLCKAEPPVGKVPWVAEVLEPLQKVKAWKLPPPHLDCSHCLGIGRVLSICEYCRGTGFVIDDDDEMFPCSHKIEGAPHLLSPCDKCHIQFANSHYSQWYMNLIRRLPGAHVGVIDVYDAMAPLYFRFVGGVGVLGPLSHQAHLN